MTVHGKEALEQIQGSWIIEVAELAGLRKAEAEDVKKFMSKQQDEFRPAYARTPIVYKRQQVFVATTNIRDFLTSQSGNRRFWPAEVVKEKRAKNVFTELEAEVNQIWAEAMQLFKEGEKLYLSDEAEAIAVKEQRKHSETDERKGLIEEYLNAGLPSEWEKLDIYDRHTHLDDPVKSQKGRLRQTVCIAEIWCECLRKNKEDMSRYNTRDINEIMKSLEDWEYHATTKNFGFYGKQKYYSRVEL